MNFQLDPELLKPVFLFNNIKFQIVAALFLITLEIIYIFSRKLPVVSTKFFIGMMIFSTLYIIADIGTVISIIYAHNLQEWELDLVFYFHNISLNTVLLFMYLYLYSITEGQKRLNPLRIVLVLSIYLASIIFTIFSKKIVTRTSEAVYFTGNAILFRYLTASAFILISLIHTIKTSTKKEKLIFVHSKNLYIYIIMGIWLICDAVQFINPKLQISSIGLSLMIFLLFISMENPGEFTDKESGAFNLIALKLVLQEKINKKKPFVIINVDIEDLSELEKKSHIENFNHLLFSITNFLFINSKSKIYRNEANSFTILLNSSVLHPLGDVEHLLNTIKNRFDKPWNIGGLKFFLKAHIDFISYPRDTKNIHSISELVEFIQECHTYTDSTDFVRRVDQSLLDNKQKQETILEIVKKAVKSDGIEMYYQPIFNIEENKFSNCESLVRLKDNQTIGFISPEVFIPLAEKNNLIHELSDKIFNQVLEFMSSDKFKNTSLKHVELNLSGAQATDADLPEKFGSLLKQYNIKPEAINLEITESMAITSGFRLKENMNKLKSLGCTFSMDDFGTGYSNLSQMAKIDYELIKIDKSLLWPIFDDKNPDKESAKIILESMVNMILKLGKKIVVEGVETEEQFNYLKSLGATYIQGYYFSKPLNKQDFIAFLNKNNA